MSTPYHKVHSGTADAAIIVCSVNKHERSTAPVKRCPEEPFFSHFQVQRYHRIRGSKISLFEKVYWFTNDRDKGMCNQHDTSFHQSKLNLVKVSQALFLKFSRRANFV